MTARQGTPPASHGSTPANREAGAEQSMSVEELIRYAHRLLSDWRANASPSRVTRLCRDYHRMAASRIPFEHYMLNNADLSELQCVRIRTSIGTIDPTGQIAAANVDRERRAQSPPKLAG